MICITGDVHQASFDNDEQRYLEGSELRAALDYQEVVDSHGLKNTLFLTGKSVDEEPGLARELATSPGVEIGGHTWAAFRPQILHRVFGFLGHPYGPKRFQSWDIGRTCEKIHNITQQSVNSWRTHAYLSNSTTERVLAEKGVEFISDTVSSNDYYPSESDVPGVISVPINTLPDHEHIYHGSRRPDTVPDSEDGWSDEFTQDSFEIDKWLKRVKKQIIRIESVGGVATILAHPSCMSIADGLSTFEKLCAWIDEKGFETSRCSEISQFIDSKQ